MSIALAITGATTLLSKVMDLFADDDKAQAQLVLKELQVEQERLNNQVEVNKNEALHRSIFVAGWRPFIGWVCGLAIFFEFLLRPILSYLLPIYYPQLGVLPSISDVLLELVFAMLGMGGLRSFEKYKGVSK